MNVEDAIRARRSIKSFTPRPIPREVVESLLETAVLAPNHRMTEPWRFLVLGPDTKREYARIRGAGKSAKVEGAEAAEAVAAKVAAEIEAVPAIVAFTQRNDPRADVREEDFAAVYMGIQNLLLAATGLGLGSHVKTGAELDLPQTQRVLGVEDGERIVAVVHLGEPADSRPQKPRTPARERTRWLP